MLLNLIVCIFSSPPDGPDVPLATLLQPHALGGSGMPISERQGRHSRPGGRCGRLGLLYDRALTRMMKV